MLRFAEELLLLTLDDENGRFARVPDRLMRYALAGECVDGFGAGESD